MKRWRVVAGDRPCSLHTVLIDMSDAPARRSCQAAGPGRKIYLPDSSCIRHASSLYFRSQFRVIREIAVPGPLRFPGGEQRIQVPDHASRQRTADGFHPEGTGTHGTAPRSLAAGLCFHWRSVFGKPLFISDTTICPAPGIPVCPHRPWMWYPWRASLCLILQYGRQFSW